MKSFPSRQLSVGRCSRGCNHSFTFRLPYLLGPPTALTVKALCPFGHRAVLTPLPVASSGITTCPNRTIDMTGLVRILTLAHLLDRSFVGCSLVGHISRYYSLLAPCQTGASTPKKGTEC